MNSALFAQTVGVFPDTGVDFTDKAGYLVKNNAGVPALNDSATVPAIAVVLEGNTALKLSSFGVLGAIPPVRLKSSGAIVKYARVQQAADGTVVTDAGPGNARVVVGVALEAAAAGDLFLCQPISPMILP